MGILKIGNYSCTFHFKSSVGHNKRSLQTRYTFFQSRLKTKNNLPILLCLSMMLLLVEGGPSCQSALGFKTWPAAACPTNLRLIHLFYSQAAFVELMPSVLLLLRF